MTNQYKNDNRKCLKIMFTSIHYLIKQGLALRGNYPKVPNTIELLKLRSNHLPIMKTWLDNALHSERSRHLLSGDYINEIMMMYSNQLLNLKLKSTETYKRHLCNNV